MGNNSIIVAIILILAVGAGAFLLVSNNDSDDSDSDETSQEESSNLDNIVDTAAATDDLSTLVTAVQAAELVDVLSDEDAEFTVFAPTNNAFSDIQSTVDTLLEPENIADLQNVLQYHVVEGSVLSGDLSDGMTVTALNGDTLEVSIDDGDVMINGAKVITADVETSNGVVHIVDAVLVP